MNNKWKDGWHTILGREVYVADGMIARGKNEKGQVSDHLRVKKTREGEWENIAEITPANFKAFLIRRRVKFE